MASGIELLSCMSVVWPWTLIVLGDSLNHDLTEVVTQVILQHFFYNILFFWKDKHVNCFTLAINCLS